jgi:hypothetical protein
MAVVSVVCTIGTVPWAGPAGAVSDAQVVASGLDEPYKLSFGPDGHLYVAEAGRGGPGPCVDEPVGPDGDPPPSCFGTTGAVTRVEGGDGAQSRVLQGLPSTSNGEDTVGPSDVVVAGDGSLLVAVGLGGNVGTRARYGPGGARLGTVLRGVPATGQVTVHADIAAFEAARTPMPASRTPRASVRAATPTPSGSSSSVTTSTSPTQASTGCSGSAPAQSGS